MTPPFRHCEEPRPLSEGGATWQSRVGARTPVGLVQTLDREGIVD